MEDKIRSIYGAVFKDDMFFRMEHAMVVSIDFLESIDRETMQAALEKAVTVCPYMTLSMERSSESGPLYFVKNPAPVTVHEHLPEALGSDELNGHLFCLYCKENRLSLYCHHGLTDGTGINWFIDALLNAYYGFDAYVYQGADEPDSCADLMEKEISVNSPFSLGRLVPDSYFTFPEAAEKEGEHYEYLQTFDRKRFELFMAEHNSTETAALWALIFAAIKKVHPENTKTIIGRSPVDARKLLGVPNTFQNASLPQFVITNANGSLDDEISHIHDEIREQTDHDSFAWYVNGYASMIKDGNKEYMGPLLQIFTLPICASYLGEIAPGSVAKYITDVKLHMNLPIPFMAYMNIAGSDCHITINQTFEDTVYVDALAEVIEEMLPKIEESAEATNKRTSDKRFLERVKDIVDEYPDRVALEDYERKVTYRELEIETGKVYHYLKRTGIGKEDVVMIVLPRAIGTIACMGGILRAGACFVPLEDTYPEDRIQFIKEDSGCKLVIDQPLLDEIMKNEPYQDGYEETDLHDACYAIYTSGSTGNPKGVLHEYGNIDQNAMAEPVADGWPEYRFGLLPPYYFVAALFFIIQQLLEAGTIYIIPHEYRQDYRKLTAYILEKKLQCLFMSPSYIRIYDKPSPWLECINTGSEPANGLYYPGGTPKIRNFYAMSESGFVVLSMELDKAYDPAPVGRPYTPVDIFILDEEGNRVEGAGMGELCFVNEYVRGYLNLPEKTKETFVDGVYHTGDLARRDEKGVYTIVGRKDEMIKINGNRIEPAEIEYRVQVQTGLEHVVAKGFVTPSRSYICVYYLKDKAKELGILDGDKLIIDREALEQVLPDYMIPAAYVGLDEFPLNANGKLNKKALAEPEDLGSTSEYVAPESDMEKLLCSLMEKALKRTQIGVNDDFYEIGGDSISALLFLASCVDHGYDIPLSELGKRRTVRELAGVCEQYAK